MEAAAFILYLDASILLGAEIMILIAENLKKLRKQKNMTQEEAAAMLNVSPQSVSKWERGDTFPDITLLPALANLYQTSIDALIGMDKIGDANTKNAVYAAEQAHLREGDYGAAAAVLTKALKTFPNEEGFLSELAMALALDGAPEKLSQAIALCERILLRNQNEKIHHTTHAALSLIYRKAGESEKAVAAAKQLPHLRESREAILAELEKDMTASDIDAYLRLIALGEN